MNLGLLGALVGLAILGIIDTLYLIIKRYKKESVICPIWHDCNKTLNSSWSKLFLVKNDVLGLVYYSAILISSIYFYITSNDILLFMRILSGIAFSTSLFLFYIQVKVVRSFCFYCITASLINLSIFIILLLLKI